MTAMSRRALLGSCLMLAAWWGAPRAARAYPEWQFSSGTARCNQCHMAPDGGGLLTEYGRDAAGEELSTFGGNGAFLHGAVEMPSWLALGGDVRGAFAGEDVQDPDGVKNAVFPMQADLYGRVAFGYGLSLHATGGFRGQVRSPGDLVPYQNYQPIDSSTFISREHYLMWEPSRLGFYARVGRFYAPFGLRLPEHFTYVRRDLGFNTLQESYNVSAGWVYERSELHVTAFAPDFLRHIGSNETGAAGYYEHRILGDSAAVAGQMKYASSPGRKRLIYGGIGKYFIAPLKTMLFAEADLVHDMLHNAGSQEEFAGAGGVSVFPARGLLITALGERSQDDMAVMQAGWTAASALLSWFPYAHLEAQFMLRYDVPGGGVAARTVFFQLHYYL